MSEGVGAWIAVGGIAVLTLVVVLVALFRARPLASRRVPGPSWSVPSPDELRATRFPLAFQGYDPEHVDIALLALVDAYEELYLAAGPGAIARARERLEQRRAPSVVRRSGQELQDGRRDRAGVLDR